MSENRCKNLFANIAQNIFVQKSSPSQVGKPSYVGYYSEGEEGVGGEKNTMVNHLNKYLPISQRVYTYTEYV